MSIRRKSARRSAVCIKNKGYEAYLYPADWFVAVEVPKAVQASLLKASQDAPMRR